jgi:ADP-ribose pyrophosphatase YjhB (NUDIX family)
MEPPSLFRYCPRCGRAVDGAAGAQPFRCRACGLELCFNAAVSAAAFVVAGDGRVLFIRRAKEPGRGKLAIVGGFVDPGETVEDALTREVREEVGLELTSLTYLASFPNVYRYHGVDYPVADLYFVCRASEPAMAAALEDVESVCWLDPRTVAPDDVAFPSMRAALVRYVASRE